MTSRAASCSSASISRARSTRGSCSGCSASRSHCRTTSCSTPTPRHAAPRRCRPRSATCAPRCSARSGMPRGRPTVTFAEELERVRALYPDLEIVLEGGDDRRGAREPRGARPVDPRRGGAQRPQARPRDVRESQRCATTAARSCSRCATTARRCTTTHGAAASGCAWRRFEALQHDGVLEYGEPSRAPGRCAWSCRPDSEAPDADDSEQAPAAASGARWSARGRGDARGDCACSSSTTTTSCTGASG